MKRQTIEPSQIIKLVTADLGAQLLRVAGLSALVLVLQGSAARAQSPLPVVDPSPPADYPFMTPHVFFTGGGFIPPNFVPGSDPSAGRLVRLISVQHTYAASFDLDLQPLLPATRPFLQPLRNEEDADGFDIDDPNNLSDDGVFWGYDLNKEIAKKYGIYLEDFNYFVPSRDVWSLAANPNPFVQGTYLENDTETRPDDPEPRALYNATDLWKTNTPTAALAALQRYKMTCNIGPQMLTGWPDPANVAAVGQPFSGVPGTNRVVVASNGLNLQLITGPLASFWGISNGGPPPHVMAELLSTSQIRFSWLGSPGATYTLERTTRLNLDGVNTWTEVATFTAPAGGQDTQLNHTEAINTLNRTVFFRLKVN